MGVEEIHADLIGFLKKIFETMLLILDSIFKVYLLHLRGIIFNPLEISSHPFADFQDLIRLRWFGG